MSVGLFQNEEDLLMMTHEFGFTKLYYSAKHLVDNLCDGCQHTFSCDSIEVCKLTSKLKKVLEDYK